MRKDQGRYQMLYKPCGAGPAGLSCYLVCLVCLLEPDRPNRPNEPDRLAGFFSILLEEPALLEVVFVYDRGRFGRKLSPFMQQSFDIFPDEV